VKKMGNDASLFLNIILVFSSMKIGKADLRLKLKKSKTDLRLKLKIWDMKQFCTYFLLFFIDENTTRMKSLINKNHIDVIKQFH